MIQLKKERKPVYISDVDELIHRMFLLTIKPDSHDPLTQKMRFALSKWQAWKARNEIYSFSDPLLFASKTEKKEAKKFSGIFGSLDDLKETDQIKGILRKLELAATAFLENNQDSDSNEVKETLLDTCLKELLKLEVSQLEILEDKQQIRRALLHAEKKELSANKKELTKRIQERKVRFSDTIDTNKTNTFNFFRKQEKKFHFRRYIDQNDKIGIFAALATNILNLGLHLGNFITISIFGIATLANSLVSILPWISTTTSTVPTLVNEIVKPTVKRKDNKFLAVVIGAILGLVGSSIILALLPTIAAASPAIAAAIPIYASISAYLSLGMFGATLIKGEIMPLISLIDEIFDRSKKIKTCENDLAGPIKFPLSRLHKQILLLKLEEIATRMPINDGINSLDEIHQKNKTLNVQLIKARKAIIAGNEDLLQNPLIQLMYHNKTMTGKASHDAFNAFMHDELRNYQHVLRQDIVQLKKEAFINALSLVGSTLALAAAVLAIIPSPVTWITAACLALVSSSISAAIKLKTMDKLADKLFDPVPNIKAGFKDSTQLTLEVLANKPSLELVEKDKNEFAPQPYPPVMPTGIMSNNEASLYQQKRSELPAVEPKRPAGPSNKV